MSIGEFARASGLTSKALRLYDDLELLRPAAVDPRSGYRSYDREQLAGACLIAALRGVGMPLERIRVVAGLPARDAAVEVRSWWRGVEADVRARRDQADLLVDALHREETSVSRPTDRPTDHAPTRLDVAARCHAGLVRSTDDDGVLAGDRLFAVADGCGEPPPEHSASAAALAALSDLDSTPSDAASSDDDPVSVLADGFRRAARAVLGLAGSGARSCDTTGTTLTAMLWRGTRFGVAHLGDSRLYRLRGGDLTLITHDHTYPQALVDEGRLTPDEAATHPERARLVRALHGRGDAGEPDLHLRDAAVGDRYLLCTDGLHAVVDATIVREILGGSQAATTTADALIEATLRDGAPDNVACVVVDLVTAGTDDPV